MREERGKTAKQITFAQPWFLEFAVLLVWARWASGESWPHWRLYCMVSLSVTARDPLLHYLSLRGWCGTQAQKPSRANSSATGTGVLTNPESFCCSSSQRPWWSTSSLGEPEAGNIPPHYKYLVRLPPVWRLAILSRAIHMGTSMEVIFRHSSQVLKWHFSRMLVSRSGFFFFFWFDLSPCLVIIY